MSWDAELYIKGAGGSDPEDSELWQCVGDWNHTHNTNHMVSKALEALGQDPGERHWLIGHLGASWWERLDGMTGAEGSVMLGDIVRELDSKPKHYKQWNPENGWGSFDSIRRVLMQMCLAGAGYPAAVFEVSG